MMISLDIVRRVRPRPEPRSHTTLSKIKGVVGVNTRGEYVTNVHTIQYEKMTNNQIVAYWPNFIARRKDAEQITYNNFATCQICCLFKHETEDDVMFLGTGAAIAPNVIVTAKHILEHGQAGYRLSNIFYTFSRSTRNIDWENSDRVGSLGILLDQSTLNVMDELYPRVSHVVGASDFTWETINDVVFLSELGMNNTPKIFHSIMIPEAVDIQRDDLIAVTGFPGYVSEEEYLKHLIEPFPYDGVRDMFENFSGDVISFGSSTVDHNHTSHRECLILYDASALGGMSGGPIRRTTATDEEQPCKRIKKTFQLSADATGYFHGIHLGGVAQMGKNLIMSVTHPAFVYQYYHLVQQAKLPFHPALNSWYKQNKTAIDTFLDPYLPEIERLINKA